MNRLQLVQRLSREAGVNQTGPSSTLSQTGEYRRLVDWIDGAWNEIQMGHLWDFLWEAASVTILLGTNVTVGTIPAKRYLQDATFNAESQLTYMPWTEFRLSYPSVLIANGIPNVWTIRPDKAFVVNAKPEANLPLTVERYKNPVVLAADADEPALPVEHHMAIVWKAMLLYANFEEAGVTRATALSEYTRHMQALGMLETPQFSFGEPLC